MRDAEGVDHVCVLLLSRQVYNSLSASKNFRELVQQFYGLTLAYEEVIRVCFGGVATLDIIILCSYMWFYSVHRVSFPMTSSWLLLFGGKGQ